ncbi:hypothetical protein [Flavobacterium capsici]|uniref:GLPGLI family protein n=1 Tax=Flavobacterium capsici TaxID=3075618 RepID=A0AA96EZF0_9FLAO|nr:MULTISPECIES: hypothetical protein [unclassified Flavobacterium]WNM20093.1 hypothetical protein RN608_05290 [Flavobacterium sp. PMR2A8]WNM21482.1 hypothetical protein RN605_12460 [Flavobacterium sp. PMTSA4]
MKKIFYSLKVSILFLSMTIPIVAQKNSVELSFESVEIDTTSINAFEGVKNAKFKLDYYHTDGYSTGNRYWYEVVIIDSLMILNFKSPDNDDWNYINYQKQVVLGDDALEAIKSKISETKLKQKTKGIPIPPGTGYGADRLYIEGDEIEIAGGTVYMCVGEEMPLENIDKRISLEKKLSSTISGDFQTFFNLLEKLFTDLPMLMKSKDKE